LTRENARRGKGEIVWRGTAARGVHAASTHAQQAANYFQAIAPILGNILKLIQKCGVISE
jgi:hypothetical protein